MRSVDIRADKVATANILLALRMKDLTYSADFLLTGELKGELGRDGLPTFFRGKISPAPELSSTTIRPITRWRSIRQKSTWNGIPAGACCWRPSRSFPARTGSRCWPILSRPTTTFPIGSWVSAAAPSCWRETRANQPLIFNRIDIGLRFDTEKRRVLLTQADISNGEIGVAGTGSIDYSGNRA